jgi:HAD superfamily hydrolase (TIGR01509 family)
LASEEVDRLLAAILLDLDGTLLDLDMRSFISEYFRGVAAHVARAVPPDRFLSELLHATDEMLANRGSERTNQQVFRNSFFPRVGISEAELLPEFEDFYRTRFPALRSHARALPEARRVVTALQGMGFKTAVATNPVFPRLAIEERLRWAGLADLPFDLITSYEVMHACKPHPEYFREVARRLSCRTEHCLMVGNDVVVDLEGARAVGMQTFHAVLDPAATASPSHSRWVPCGTLADLADWIRGKGGRSGADHDACRNPALPVSMQVRLHACPTLARHLPGRATEQTLTLPAGASLREAIALAGIPEDEVWLAAINGARASLERALAEGDEVLVFAPIGGG